MTNLILLLLAIVAVALLESYRRRSEDITRAARRLTQVALSSPVHGGGRAAEVPAPVARYLQLALRTTRPPPRLVRIAQEGSLRTDVRSKRWMDFRAEHTVAPLAQAFVWNASVAAGPLVHVRVLDSLLDGVAESRVQLMSAVELDRVNGSVEVNSGSLHRYLAEAVWYPWVLIPGEHLAWTPIDARRALATLTVKGLSVALEFRFANSGEVVGVYTPARWGRFGQQYVQVPWEGEFREYREFDGFVLPSEASVGWHSGGELQWVWTGRVDAVVTES